VSAPGERFRQELQEQPARAARLLESAPGPARLVAAALRRRRPAALVIVTQGSSDHAATYAKYLFEMRNRLPVALAAPSAFTLYRRPPDLASCAVVAISQSGSSEDVAEVVREARRQGSLTVALTNRSSELAAGADLVLDLAAGGERSLSASKTDTTSLLALALVSQALDPDPAFAVGLAAVPDAIERALRIKVELERAARLLAGPRMAVLGRGFNLATAEQVALKVMETCSVVAESRSVADFLHGPIAVVGPGFPVLLIEAAGPTLGGMRALARRLIGLRARLALLTDRDDGVAEVVIRVRTGLPEELTPIPFAVVGQLLVLSMALDRGLDPDRPRGLGKVTVTG
jgi:glucosamine--fructose-6-phosphate aminotransferase (isomerizing)